MTKVSVIMSVYNGIEYKDRAVPSILNQTFKDFEFLIIDDGSDDGTSDFLKEAEKRDGRVRVFRQERVGLARAVNHALSFAAGKYIIRQDFDDISYPERIERQVEFLDRHPEVGLVGTYYVIDDQRRGEKYIRKQPLDDDHLRRTMAKCIPFAHTLVAIRKEALTAVGGIAETNNITDLRTWIKIGAAGWKFANIPEVLGVHYVYGESYWHKNYTYTWRQRDLAKVQVEAIRELDLPRKLLVYPAARYFYSLMPTRLKRFMRRSLAGSNEEDM
jgi:glycosyltransferase EpsE